MPRRAQMDDTIDPVRSRLAAAAATFALAATVAGQSAATSDDGSVATWLLLTVHLAATATWVGGFVALLVLVLPRRQPADFDDQVLAFLPISYAALGLEQQYIEQFLWEAVRESGLVDLRWQSEVRAVEDNAGGVTLSVSDPGGA